MGRPRIIRANVAAQFPGYHGDVNTAEDFAKCSPERRFAILGSLAKVMGNNAAKLRRADERLKHAEGAVDRVKAEIAEEREFLALPPSMSSSLRSLRPKLRALSRRCHDRPLPHAPRRLRDAGGACAGDRRVGRVGPMTDEKQWAQRIRNNLNRQTAGAVEVSRLRAVSEDEVVKALDNSYAAETLEGIAPVVLLELYNRIIDQVVGEQ